MKNVGRNQLPAVDGHVINVTLNLSIIAIVYVVIGAATATLIRTVFARFNEEWKNHALAYQIAEVSLELSFLVVASFWVTYFVPF
jgi:hypothetical protein